MPEGGWISVSSWMLACQIWADWQLDQILNHPIPGVKYINPEKYVEIQLEKLYFSRMVFHDG